MILEVLTPGKLLYNGNVEHVQMPGLNGSFGVLENHAPLISALKAGRVSVKQADKQDSQVQHGSFFEDIAKSKDFDFEITGGVAEINNNKIIILAE